MSTTFRNGFHCTNMSARICLRAVVCRFCYGAIWFYANSPYFNICQPMHALERRFYVPGVSAPKTALNRLCCDILSVNVVWIQYDRSGESIYQTTVTPFIIYICVVVFGYGAMQCSLFCRLGEWRGEQQGGYRGSNGLLRAAYGKGGNSTNCLSSVKISFHSQASIFACHCHSGPCHDMHSSRLWECCLYWPLFFQHY